MKTEFECEKFGFEVCRICMTPKTSSTFLESLFDEDGTKAEMLQLLTGFDDILDDEGSCEALICSKCSRKLEQLYEFRRCARYAERNYFRLLRDNKEFEEANMELISEVKVEQEQFEIFSGEDNYCNYSNEMIEYFMRSVNTEQIEDCHQVNSYQNCLRSRLKQTNLTEALVPQKQCLHEGNSSEVEPKLIENQSSNNHFFLKEMKDDKEQVKLKTTQKTGETAKVMKQRSILDMYSKIKVENSIAPDFKIDRNPVLNKTVKIEKFAITKMFSSHRTLSKNTYKCKICKKVLATKHYLRKHVISMHNGEKNFTCDFCNKSVYHKHHMIYHMKLHIKNPEYKGATSDKDRPFQCHLCSSYFQTVFVLQQHLSSHTNIRPFRCWCGSAFKTKGIFKTHLRNVHQDYSFN